MLGSTLVLEWAPRYRIVALSHSRQLRWPGVQSHQVDLLDHSEVTRVIREARPDLVVHAAAWTDADGCELNPERALAINAEGSKCVAQASADVGADCIYISTDGVFDGVQGGYVETDRPAPINAYARSKLRGEDKVLAANPQSMVVRVGLEGWRPVGRPGFIQWVVESLSKGERITICTDWIRSFVFASNLPSILEKMWGRGLRGLYHVASSDSASNYNAALITAEVFGLDPSGLMSISGDDLNLRAQRPKDTSLDGRKLLAAIDVKVLSIREGIMIMRAERDNRRVADLQALFRPK